jgi:glycosyltransferase involved in cell wall biosynthesis
MMHVGVHIHDYTPTAGGGYSFQRDILRAALELAPRSTHRFSVLAYHTNELIQSKKSFGSVGLIPIQDPATEPVQQRGLLQKFRGEPETPVISDALSPLDFTLKKNNIDLVWFVSPAYELTDVPYIATVWDLQHRLQPWFPEVGRSAEWNGRETYIATFLRRAAYILAANATGRQEVHQLYQIPEDRVIGLGHPTPALVPASAHDIEQTMAKYGLRSGYLFYPAQYWAHKNHASLLFALKFLKERRLGRLSAVFVGSDKGNLPYLKKLAANLGVEKQVHFLGFVTDLEMTALYKNALALVYLSFFGPENLPPLEAFSVGCPVIASRVSGASEQLGDAALLVSPTDVQEIASAIQSLQDDGQRQTLIERGFKRTENATSRNYVSRVFALLDEFELIRRAWGSSA